MTHRMSQEEVIKQVEEKAKLYVKRSNNCCQATFLALQEQFELGNSLLLKACTIMPGIAGRGETCGAVVAGLMALGIVHGRDDIDDMEQLAKALRKGRRFCQDFEAEFGSTRCSEVQKLLFGRSFDFWDTEQAAEFQHCGGRDRCGIVVAKAARIFSETYLGLGTCSSE